MIPWEDNNDPSLPNSAQAIVTTYTFQCCGYITRWKAWVQPGGRMHTNGAYDIEFQVWRPSSDLQYCYKKVGGNVFNDIELQSIGSDEGLVNKNVPMSNYIAVQPGDVVGYRANSTSRGDNQGIQLATGSNYDANQVWYHSSPTERSDPDCPVSVGSENGRVLNSVRNAAPVLQLDIGKNKTSVSIVFKPQVVVSKHSLHLLYLCLNYTIKITVVVLNNNFVLPQENHGGKGGFVYVKAHIY